MKNLISLLTILFCLGLEAQPSFTGNVIGGNISGNGAGLTNLNLSGLHIWYVELDGNDNNSGGAPGSNSAFLTFTNALTNAIKSGGSNTIYLNSLGYFSIPLGTYLKPDGLTIIGLDPTKTFITWNDTATNGVDVSALNVSNNNISIYNLTVQTNGLLTNQTAEGCSLNWTAGTNFHTVNVTWYANYDEWARTGPSALVENNTFISSYDWNGVSSSSGDIVYKGCSFMYTNAQNLQATLNGNRGNGTNEYYGCRFFGIDTANKTPNNNGHDACITLNDYVVICGPDNTFNTTNTNPNDGIYYAFGNQTYDQGSTLIMQGSAPSNLIPFTTTNDGDYPAFLEGVTPNWFSPVFSNVTAWGNVISSNKFIGNGSGLTNVASLGGPVLNAPVNSFYSTIGTAYTNASGKRGFFDIPFSWTTGSGTGWGANCYITNYTGPVGAAGTITNVSAYSMGSGGLTALVQSGSNTFTGFLYSNSVVNVVATVGTITALNTTNNQSNINWQ
jgi:hypothetical protein